MISLAQYLPEFEDDRGPTFRSAPRPSRRPANADLRTAERS